MRPRKVSQQTAPTAEQFVFSLPIVLDIRVIRQNHLAARTTMAKHWVRPFQGRATRRLAAESDLVRLKG